MIFSLDSQLVSYHHYLKGLPKDSMMIRDISTHHHLATLSFKNEMLTGNAHPLLTYLQCNLQSLDTGLGNVTAVAIDFALKNGYREIEVFGADYSFPPGKAYSRGTYIINHFEYRQSRLSSLEHKMYDFSSNVVKVIQVFIVPGNC